MSIVVIVDNDEEDMLNIERMFQLSNCQFEYMFVRDVQEALDLPAEEEVSVLVSIPDMPYLSGKELFETYNVLSTDTQKILLTKYENIPEMLTIINELHISQIVLKPLLVADDIVHPIEAAQKAYDDKRALTRQCNRLEVEKNKSMQASIRIRREYNRQLKQYNHLTKVFQAFGNYNLTVSGMELSKDEQEKVCEFFDKSIDVYNKILYNSIESYKEHTDKLKLKYHHPDKKKSYAVFLIDEQSFSKEMIQKIIFSVEVMDMLVLNLLKEFKIAITIEKTKQGCTVDFLCVGFEQPDTLVYKTTTDVFRNQMIRMTEVLLKMVCEKVNFGGEKIPLSAKIYINDNM